MLRSRMDGVSLLLRHLTRRVWSSLVGGYLFGFSSYMLGQELGHLHATSVFLVPLVALVVLRYVDGAWIARGSSSRPTVTRAPALFPTSRLHYDAPAACSIAVGIVVARAPAATRTLTPRLRCAMRWRRSSRTVCLLPPHRLPEVGDPPAADFVTDLLNFVIPTKLALSGHGWAQPDFESFPGNDSERGAYSECRRS